MVSFTHTIRVIDVRGPSFDDGLPSEAFSGTDGEAMVKAVELFRRYGGGRYHRTEAYRINEGKPFFKLGSPHNRGSIMKITHKIRLITLVKIGGDRNDGRYIDYEDFSGTDAEAEAKAVELRRDRHISRIEVYRAGERKPFYVG